MLGCIVALIAFFFPRVAIVLLWIFSELVQPKGFTHWVWPLLGLIFLPYTVLAYLLGVHMTGGTDLGIWWAGVGLAALFDLGLVGWGAKKRRKR